MLKRTRLSDKTLECLTVLKSLDQDMWEKESPEESDDDSDIENEK